MPIKLKQIPEILEIVKQFEDDKDDFWGALTTLVLGGLALGAISSWFKPRCPQCSIKIMKGELVCPNCGTYLNQR